jgi:hypothetical protein
MEPDHFPQPEAQYTPENGKDDKAEVNQDYTVGKYTIQHPGGPLMDYSAFG